MSKKFGDVFYSDFFNSKAVVVNYISDDEWYFVLEMKPNRWMRAKAKPDELEWLNENQRLLENIKDDIQDLFENIHILNEAISIVRFQLKEINEVINNE